MRRIILLLVALILNSEYLRAQAPAKDRPAGVLPPDVLGFPQPPARPDADYQPAGPGLISLAETEELQRISALVTALLDQAPNDPTGKQSDVYPPLQAWGIAASEAATNKTQLSVINLIPAMATIFAMNLGGEEYCQQFEEVRRDIKDIFVLNTIANYVTEHDGVIDVAILSKFVKAFSVTGFAPEYMLENGPLPIERGGVMILDASAVVTLLEAGPWKEAATFLANSETSADFFSSYVTEGAGLSVLKTKYAADQTTIDAKFVELKTWVDANRPPPEG